MMRLRKSIALIGMGILMITCLMLYLSIEVAQLPVGIDGFKSESKKNEISTLEQRLFRLENDLKKNHKTIDEIIATVKSMLKVENQLQWKHLYDQLQKLSVDYVNHSECNIAELVSPPVDIQMLELYDELPFDDSDGGVWKQGWPIQYDANQWTDQNKLKVFVVPHSHNDPGWIKTYEKYFVEQTQHILNGLVKKLPEDPKRKFIWAEISFMSSWWRKTTRSNRAIVRKLVQDGQLEIVTGGWVMNDEASTHYYAILEQLVEGHEWITNHLGVKPKNGWAIDPFGLSPTMAYLLKRMQFSSMVIQRTHYSIKKHFSKEKSLEFLWKQSWDPSSSADILCHMMPFYSYDIPHTCGPDPKVCCQFDFKRLPGSKIVCPWRISPQPITPKNVEDRSKLLLDQYRKKAQLFRTNVLLVPLGDDFRFDKLQEWDQQFNNYKLIFDYMNKRKDWNVEAQFGTLNDYFTALIETQAQKHDNPLQEFPSFSGDFFTYADREDHYWSGYFTSRPFYKNMDRVLEAYLRGSEILFSQIVALTAHSVSHNADDLNYLTDILVQARRNLGLFQHHDGITGTAKDGVVIDYANRLLKSIDGLQKILLYSAEFLLAGRFPKLNTDPIFVTIDKRTSYSAIPENLIFNMSNTSSRVLVLYNSLSQNRQEAITIHFSSPYVCITDIHGKIVANQVNPVWQGDHIAPNHYQIVFMGDMPGLGFATYTINAVDKSEISNCNIHVPSIAIFNAEWEVRPSTEPFANIEGAMPSNFTLNNSNVEAMFNSNGMLKAIKLRNEGVTLNTQLQFLKYGVRNSKEKSGAYLFLPDKEAQPITFENPIVRIIQGSLMSEVQVFLPNIFHTVRLINSSGPDGLGIEINNIVDITAEVNKELVMRLITDISPANHEFFTDSNGFQILKRKTLKKLPLQGNYYPMPSLAYIEDNQTRLTVLSAQPLGVGSLQSGCLEIMLDRRLNQDDHRGLEQGVTDNKRTPNRFRILVEKKFNSPMKPQVKSPHGFLSLVGHIAMLSVLHPPFVLMSRDSLTNNKLKFASYSSMLKDLPCDLHVLNLRTSILETEDMKLIPKNSTALYIHRFAHDCGIVHPRFKCSFSGGQISIGDILPHLFNEEVTRMSLTLLHEEQQLNKSQTLHLEPMEIYAFRMTR